MRSNHAKYPLGMRVYHLILAVLMISILLIGWQMEDNKSLMPLHKSLGVLILIFGLLRLFNRFSSARSIPNSVNAKGSIQLLVEKLVHGGLYVIMLGMPIGGILMSQSFGYPVSFFGLFNVPTVVGKNPEFAEQLAGFHGLGANIFFGLLILHVVGAVFHLLAHKENIFKRMF